MDPQTLAHAVEYTEHLFTRYLSGFQDDTRTTMTTDLPNHPIWMLGHCALSMNRLAERFDGQGLPETDYVPGGDDLRFDPDLVSKGSVPLEDPARYPGLARGLEVFRAAITRLAGAVRGTSAEMLDTPTVHHGTTLTNGELVLRICFHNGCHAGQLTDLRRAIEFPRVIPD
ncbi:MAG: DinB family protein [Phycisphaerales bacterium]|nr:DinB family protein [Phycisphaerales bacterium]